MHIKKIKIKNYKSLRDNDITLSLPDGITAGSGLNLLIGENNVGKSSLFEVLRKIENKLVDEEEINVTGRGAKEEIQITIENHTGEIMSYESRYYLNHDPDNNIYITRSDFQCSFYHVNTNRRLTKKTNFTELGNRRRNGKDESLEEKVDSYQIIQELHKMTPDKKDEFCAIVNSFLPEIERIYVQTSRRSNEALLSCRNVNGDLIDVRDMGSGIEQFIILLWILKFSNDKIILLDEPEISLHPKAQIRLIELLIEVTKEKQIIVATHSPYLFKDFTKIIASILIFRKENGHTKINDLKSHPGIFPWSPSWGEINYYAYDFLSVDFHNELYGFLQEKTGMYSETEFENFLLSKGINKTQPYIKSSKGIAQPAYPMSLPTYIRNQIHHPENLNNPLYTSDELRESIEILMSLV